MRVIQWPLVIGVSSCLIVPSSAQETDEQAVSDMVKSPPPVTRSELRDSETPLPEVGEASTDPAHLTPLPIEMAEHGAHLPEGLELVVPFDGEFAITQGYGYEAGGWTHRTIGNERSANDFFAIDVGMPEGTQVLAAADGRIVTSNLRDDSYGNYVVIDHGGGLTSIYAHLRAREFDVMDASPEVHVEAGEVIAHSGQSGTTSPHLHFAVHTDADRSHSGCDVGGLATVPEPMGGRYGLREDQALEGRARIYRALGPWFE